jgi:molybdopterin synthase sulfur carrier subunit
MRIRAKLYGTLSQQFPDYRGSEGIEVEIPDGATVKDLLDRLGISESKKAVVAMEGRILKGDDTIRHGVPVQIFNAIHGG